MTGRSDRGRTETFPASMTKGLADVVTDISRFEAFRYSLICVLLLVWLIPVMLLVYLSIYPPDALLHGSVWDPPGRFALFSNMQAVTDVSNFYVAALNSFIYAIVAGTTAVFLASVAAFAIARLDVPAKNVFLYLILLFTFFPFHMYLIPLVKMYQITGLYDTRIGIIIVYTAVAIPFATFIMRNYYVTLPSSLYEAALIDGLSKYQIYWRIYLPLAKPAFTVALIFQYIWAWNEFVLGLVLTSSPSARPIAAALNSLNGLAPDFPVLAVAALITATPPVILYLVFQKQFERGLISGAKVG